MGFITHRHTDRQTDTHTHTHTKTHLHTHLYLSFEHGVHNTHTHTYTHTHTHTHTQKHTCTHTFALALITGSIKKVCITGAGSCQFFWGFPLGKVIFSLVLGSLIFIFGEFTCLRNRWFVLLVLGPVYSPLHLKCHFISISNLNLLGLFSTERGKRDLEN